MKPLSLTIEGVSEQEVQEAIRKNTQGYYLFFVEPTGADYIFINTFWGKKWDGTPENLRQHINEVMGIKGTTKIHHGIVTFMLNGKERFHYCSWTHELYDCNTQVKYPLEPKYTTSITKKIAELTR